MQTRVEELEGDLERERAVGLKLSGELAGLRESSRSQSQEIARLEAERLDSAAMQTRVAELEDELERERAVGLKRSAELAGLRESNRSQSEELARLEAERLDSAAMQSRVSELETQIDQVQQAEGRAVRELGRAGQRITDLEQTLARERTVKQDLLNEMQQNEQALLRQSTERGELASRLEERTANLDRARQELAELSGQLEGVTRDLTGRIETSARAREADRASLAQSYQRIERLEAQVDTGARGIEALEAQLRAVEQERDRARGRRDELESELQAQQAALASARADVQALREAQTASKLTVEELARIQARVGELEKQLGESESERAGLDQELLALRAADRDRAVLAASHERLAVELAEARARIESLEEPPAGGAPEKLAAAGPSADVGPAPILKPGAPPRLEPAVIAPLPDVGEFVQAWADAWSRKDVGGYLASYSSRFRPADGSSRPAWERVRRQRLTKPKYIEVTVTELRTELIGRDRARATFRQAYRADHYRDSVSKTLLLVLEDGEWRIAEENSR